MSSSQHAPHLVWPGSVFSFIEVSNQEMLGVGGWVRKEEVQRVTGKLNGQMKDRVTDAER